MSDKVWGDGVVPCFAQQPVVEEKKVRVRCSKCASSQVYVLKKGLVVCRRCGFRG